MDTRALPTPVYVIDEDALRRNLDILHSLEERTGCRVLLAQKAFSAYYFYPLIGSYISGTAASGLYEARLGREEMGKENHVFSPAYTDAEFGELTEICDHIVFNSFSQLEKFYGRRGGASVGMRVNPECSTQDHAIYDPCAPGSRMGVRASDFRGDMADMLDGLHMHTLCEQNADALEVTVKALEEKFGASLPRMKWLNLDYDEGPVYQMDRLERYREVVDQMLADGRAYYCYATPEELDAMREEQKAKGLKPRYDGRWRPENCQGKPIPEGVKPVIRFRNPDEGAVTWNDAVYGTITVSNSELDDLIIMRNGIPTYNFAVVVDDWDMEVSHVIRGADHINNTPRQINIYRALGAEVPVALAVSLHAPDDALRDMIMPVNKKHPLEDLMAACRRYLKVAPRDFITFEYLMLGGINDQPKHARELIELVRTVPCKFNLITFNPFPDSDLKRPERETVLAFAKILNDAGIVTTIRKTRGDDIDAACGQLAGEVKDRTRRAERLLEQKRAFGILPEQQKDRA